MTPRILYIANARFPSARAHGIQLQSMVEAFARAGVSVELFVPHLPRANAAPIRGVSVRRVWTTPWRASRIGFLLSSLIFGILSVLTVLPRRGILYSIDLDYFSFFLIPFLGRPYFFEIHSAKRPTLPHRLLFSRATGVIAVNESVRRALEESFPRLRGRTMVFPNGVDLARYEVPPRAGLMRPAAVYTGSFQDWKGVDTVLAGAAALPAVSFYLVGGAASELPAASPPNVSVIPPVAFSEVPAWQKAADVLLLTGTAADEYSYRYTSPMKLREYMAAGRPVVAAQTPAITQEVSDEEAFFYEPDNAESLVRAVREALENPEEGARRAEKLRARAGDYTWERRAARILGFIAAHRAP